MLVVSLLFQLAFLQDMPWYEHYQLGREAMEAEQYEKAVTHFENAIADQPKSKRQAKTYGVQFIQYYPYHQLAEAHLWTNNRAAAARYLELADRWNEDEDARTAERMKLFRTVLNRLPENPTVVTDPDPTPKRPDTGPFWELVSLKKYTAAMSVLQDLQQQYPDNDELKGIDLILNLLVANDNELLEFEKATQQTEQRLLGDAQREEENGNTPQALAYYLAVNRLKPGQPDIRQAIERLRGLMEAQGKTALEIEQAQNDALQLAEETEKRLQNTLQKQAVLQNANTRLLSDLEKARASQADPPPAEVSVSWNLVPISTATKAANINAQISSDTPMKTAKLYINGQLHTAWDLYNQQQFDLPTISNFTFDRFRNELKLVMRDSRNKVHQAVYPYSFPTPPPVKNRPPFLQFIFIPLALLLLGIFFVRKRRKSQAFRNRFNPYIAGAPVLNADMFYGRKPMLKQLLNTLHNNSIMIYGERRIGKTSFLHQLYALLPTIDDPQYQFIPVFIDLQGVAEEEFFTTLDHEIQQTLEPFQLEMEPVEGLLSGRQLTQRLRKTINQLKSHCERSPKLVLLLDEVDLLNSFSEHTNQQLRAIFMKGFAKHLVAVMAGININTTWKSEGSPWYNFFEQLELKPFSEDQARTLVTDPVRGIYSYNAEAIDKILDLTRRKPYLIQKMCVNLVAHVLNQNRKKITTQDVLFVYTEIRHEVEKGL
ncbi:ATP-binding protein [Acanthopleuribacter pedis]|uniref:AAA family ATPase n=1 Tax=Acanthopleuribacter pedis TaxID=442870 RepID=A0A8J7U2E3_9BACT|nr:ATP-binding protein [Acanthopleuribacter pedis]MBO1317173.1 AAA family ATPase [Acanthopleuribacter pedis]